MGRLTLGIIPGNAKDTISGAGVKARSVVCTAVAFPAVLSLQIPQTPVSRAESPTSICPKALVIHDLCPNALM